MISFDDLEALRWAGFLGHRWFIVRDNHDPSRTKPGVCGECNDLAGCMKHAEAGDHIYQKISKKRFKLVTTVGQQSTAPNMAAVAGVLIAACMMFAGCGPSVAPAVQTSTPERFTVERVSYINSSRSSTAGDIAIITDTQTHAQYLAVGGYGVTALRSDVPANGAEK